MCPTPNSTWRLQLALCTRELQMQGNLLTLHPLVELLHELAAVLFCDTCKFHCFEEDLPCAVVTLSLLPRFKAILNGFLFIMRVVLVTEINPVWSKSKEFQDDFAFPSTALPFTAPCLLACFLKRTAYFLQPAMETEGETFLN